MSPSAAIDDVDIAVAGTTADSAIVDDTQPDGESPQHVSTGGVRYTSAEEADATSLLSQLTVPSFLQYWYNRYYYDRKYVSDDALLLDDKDTVSVNYLYRNTQVLTAQLLARDPQIVVRPKEVLGEAPPLLDEFGLTCQLLVQDVLTEAGLRDKMNAAVADASGVGWAIFKLSPQEDFKLDPLGQSRNNDELDNLAMCEWLRKRFAARDFTSSDPDYQRMVDCEKQVAIFLQRKMEKDLAENPPGQIPMIDPMTGMPLLDPVTGMPLTMMDQGDERLIRLQTLESGQIPTDMDLPEIARYIGIIIDRVMPEDFRFDWSVSDPSELRRQCRWMAHRVYVDRDTFGAKFQIPVDDWKAVTLYNPDGSRTDRFWQANPTDRPDAGGVADTGASKWDDRAAVWVVYHKERGMVYTLVEGLPYPVTAEPIGPTWREWFPFTFLYFNRVDGRAIPMSDTLLARNLQDEINRLRSQDLEYRNFSLPRFIIRRGSMTPDEKATAENSHAGQFLEMAFDQDVRAAFAQPTTIPYNPQINDPSFAKMQMQEMLGTTAQAMGNDQGNLATTAALANQYMGTQMDFRRFQLEKCMKDIATFALDVLMVIMPEKNVQARVGQGAVWPMIDRETMYQYIKLEVRAGSTGKPDANKRKEFFTLLPTVAQGIMGNPMLNFGEVMQEFFRSWDIADDPRRFFLPGAFMPPMPGMMPGMAPGIPGMAGPPGSIPPGATGVEGGPPGPGAPTMAERGPPTPETIPNGRM